MFTYLDPSVRSRLIEEGKLIRINSDGRVSNPIASDEQDTDAISVLGPIALPLECGQNEHNVDWYASVRHTRLDSIQALADSLLVRQKQEMFAELAASMAVNSVLVHGDRDNWRNPLVRIHSSCHTGDVFGSKRCECGPQFFSALDRIASDPAGGMIIYMSGHEGRGIGLWAKAATYLLQDAGENTYEANRSLGLPDDSRDFRDAATLLKYFHGDRPFRLLTNNPKKIRDLNEFGLNHVTRVKHVVGVNEMNCEYLSAKQDWGHGFENDDLVPRRKPT